jgi:hypothetical protein
VLPYAAYLRVYEPLTAFAEPDRSAWERYAVSVGLPRRASALDVEHAAAMRRLVSRPPVVAPDRESTHAYVRRSEEMIYVCPWQIRLRSWLAFTRFRARLPPGVADSFVPGKLADKVESDFEQWKQRSSTLRSYILSSNWHVPLAWFVPFGPSERCLVLGSPEAQEAQGGRPEGGAGGPTTAARERTLVYTTPMPEARRRVATAIRVVCRTAPRGGFEVGNLATLGNWLEGFHPFALVELDYGGLVHLVDDKALRSDESVAEVAAVLDCLERDEVVAIAMYQRVQARWRSVRTIENAN